MHWADQYVGLPPEGRDPCWLLVRRVWAEQCGQALPRFDDVEDPEREFQAQALRRGFVNVARHGERPFDAVLMNETVRDRDGGFRSAVQHIGVVVRPGLLLHVKRGELSCIETLRSQAVARIVRPPWLVTQNEIAA